MESVQPKWRCHTSMGSEETGATPLEALQGGQGLGDHVESTAPDSRNTEAAEHLDPGCGHIRAQSSLVDSAIEVSLSVD